MQKSYECEVATHIGPESCGAARKGGVEALTGGRAGRVFSRVRNSLRDADAVGESGRPHPVPRYREVQRSPARSQTPCTYANTNPSHPEFARRNLAGVAKILADLTVWPFSLAGVLITRHGCSLDPLPRCALSR